MSGPPASQPPSESHDTGTTCSAHRSSRPHCTPHRRRYSRQCAAPHVARSTASWTAPSSIRVLAALADRDRALVRKLVATVLRRIGSLRHLLQQFLEFGFPKDAPRVETRAADRRRADPVSRRAGSCGGRSQRAAGAGGPPRREVSGPDQRGAAPRDARRTGAARRSLDVVPLDTPPWLFERWTQTLRRGDRARDRDGARSRAAARSHGEVRRRKLGAAPARPRDADRNGAHRHRRPGLAAARLSAKAPGGCRTPPQRCRRACSATSPARRSPTFAPRPAARPRSSRMPAPRSPRSTARPTGSMRVRENLARLGLHADMVAADVTEWQAEPFDAVLVDAPCSSTGTIRRHPDVGWLKTETRPRAARRPAAAPARPRGRADQAGRTDRLLRLLARAGGRRAADRGVARPRAGRPPQADRPGEIAGIAEFINAAGDLRTLPCHWPDPEPRMSGLDGFFAARLERISSASFPRLPHWPRPARGRYLADLAGRLCAARAG